LNKNIYSNFEYLPIQRFGTNTILYNLLKELKYSKTQLKSTSKNGEEKTQLEFVDINNSNFSNLQSSTIYTSSEDESKHSYSLFFQKEVARMRKAKSIGKYEVAWYWSRIYNKIWNEISADLPASIHLKIRCSSPIIGQAVRGSYIFARLIPRPYPKPKTFLGFPRLTKSNILLNLIRNLNFGSKLKYKQYFPLNLNFKFLLKKLRKENFSLYLKKKKSNSHSKIGKFIPSNLIKKDFEKKKRILKFFKNFRKLYRKTFKRFRYKKRKTYFKLKRRIRRRRRYKKFVGCWTTRYIYLKNKKGRYYIDKKGKKKKVKKKYLKLVFIPIFKYYRNRHRLYFRFYVPKYLEINYKTFCFTHLDNAEHSSIGPKIPLALNLGKVQTDISY
jgi:hypothetical protein